MLIKQCALPGMELKQAGQFKRVRRTPGNPRKTVPDLFYRFRRMGQNALSQRAGAFGEDFIIEQGECLQGRAGPFATRAGLVGLRRIKGG